LVAIARKIELREGSTVRRAARRNAREPGRRRAWRPTARLRLTLSMAMLVGLALALTAGNAVLAQRGYELSELEDELTQARAEAEGLEVRVAAMQSLDRVERIAREQLGMTRPSGYHLAGAPTESREAPAMASAIAPEVQVTGGASQPQHQVDFRAHTFASRRAGGFIGLGQRLLEWLGGTRRVEAGPTN